MFLGSQLFPFSILGSEVKQRRDSPSTSLKRLQPTSDRPETFAGPAVKRKRKLPGSSVKLPILTLTVKEGAPENDDEIANKESSFKEGKPNDLALNELASKIAAKWQTLGLHLLISQDTLDEIDANEKDKPYRMLLRWKGTTASTTLYQDLYNALCHDKVGLNNVAKEFCCRKTT